MIYTETGKVNIRGIDHYYEWIRERRDRNEEKPAMIFVHGWGGSCRYWRSTAEAMTDKFDCLLYDLRGFGQSLLVKNQGQKIGYELEEYAQDLVILLDKFQLDKVYINAHSMGASVAVFFLNLVPKRVAKAILTCNGIFSYNPLSFSAFHKIGSYVVKFRYNWFLKVPLADKLFMARFLNRPIPRDLRRAFLEDFLLADYEAALGTLYSSVNKKAVEIMPKEFAGIQVPTLLISGEKDRIIPASMGREASLLNELLSYVEIASTAHFPMLEDTNTYLAAVREFLQE